MARKKPVPAQDLTPEPFDAMDVFQGFADEMGVGSGEAMVAAMEFEKTLLKTAHEIASQAVRVGEPDDEPARVEAAERQVELIGRLYRQLRTLVQGS